MVDPTDIIRGSLEDIGFGPERMAEVFAGTALFGPSGLLNSLELVQLVVALSERSGLDPFELMSEFDIISENVFRDVTSLRALLDAHLVVSAGA